MRVGRRLGDGGKHIQLVSQPIRLFPICTVSPPTHSTMATRAESMIGAIVQWTCTGLALMNITEECFHVHHSNTAPPQHGLVAAVYGP
jgi:hypothetical protein